MTDVSAENQALVDMLEEVWGSMAELGASLDETEWKAPSECPGWSVQDNLVHITAMERFIQDDPLPMADVPDDLPHVKNDIGRSNERWIESRRSWAGADALAEFVSTTDARIAAAPGARRRRLRRRLVDADGTGHRRQAPRLPPLRLVGARAGHAGRAAAARRPRLRRRPVQHADDGRRAPVRGREEGGGSRRFHRRARAHRTDRHHRRRWRSPTAGPVHSTSPPSSRRSP